MNPDPTDWRAAEARALIATLAIAVQAQWIIDRVGPVFSLPIANYLYAEQAQMLLIPTARHLADEMAIVASAVRETRSDALIVRSRGRHSASVELALGRWTHGRPRWHAPMTLWCQPDQPLWLAPDPYHAGVRHQCFRLENAVLEPGTAPWADAAEQRQGLAEAAAWTARILAAH